MLAVLLAGAAYAQEALRSNLSTDAAIAARPGASLEARPDQPHWGPVDFTLGAYVSARFDDNITLVQHDTLDDDVLGAGLDLGFVWPATDTSRLQLRSQAGYARYLRHSAYDSLELSPNSALTWDVSFDDGGVTAYDQFSYSRQVITEAALSGVATLPRFDNVAGLRTRWLPQRWQFEAGYSHDEYVTDSSSATYLDRSSEYVFLRAGWRFAEGTQLGLEGSAGWTDYRLPSQPDNTSYSAGAYVQWQISQFLQATARGGPTWYSFDARTAAAGSDRLGSYYANFELNHQLTEFIHQRIDVQREVQLGLYAGSKYIEQLTAGYGITWSATRYASIGLDLTYEHGTQPLIEYPFLRTEKFDRFGVSPLLAYQLTDRVSARLGYQYWTRSSNLSGRDYRDNSVTLGVNVTF